MGSGQTPTPSVHVQTKTVSTAISAGRMATAMATATATATDPGVNATFARTKKRCSTVLASQIERVQPNVAQYLALAILTGNVL